MVHYAVVVNGKVVGSRSSESHAQQIYTHAVVEAATGDRPAGVISYHSTPVLAETACRSWANTFSQAAAHWPKRGTLSVVPVSVTAKRAKVGDLVVPQGVL